VPLFQVSNINNADNPHKFNNTYIKGVLSQKGNESEEHYNVGSNAINTIVNNLIDEIAIISAL
jgi:hypothetical protein